MSSKTEPGPEADTLLERPGAGTHTAPLRRAGAGGEAALETELTCGDAVGRFVVLGVLGSGGMGHVYSAYDPQLDRKVAIKLLRAEVVLQQAHDAPTRLLREAQAMAKINHPNVIKVHEVGTYGAQVYLAMEFADGGTLRAWLDGRRTQREIIEACVQAGRGLAAAHAVGLVHRDFKPDNVLMGKDGSARVTDFGLVGVAAPSGIKRALSAPPIEATIEAPDLTVSGTTPLSEDLTRTGAIMGTPPYMAPEQFSGEAATARTDQFSFCVLLYEALHGERPFAGTTLQEIAANVLDGRVSPPPKGARVPRWLRRVLLRGLSVDPAARHASMDALLSELGRDPARRRRRILAWTAGAGALATAAAVLLALRPGNGATCDAGGGRTATVWSPARRDRMQAAFLASGRPHAAATFDRLTPILDAWLRSWELGYRDACEATRVRGEQSEHLLDLRMQCLTRRLDEASATIALLAAGGGDAVDHALEAALALPAIAPCGDAASLTAAVAPPETVLAREQVQAVRGRLDEARGLQRLGRYPAALAAARAALAAARTTGYRPVIAEALFVVGWSQYELSDAAAADSLRESMHAATASGDAAGVIAAAEALIGSLAASGSRYEIGHEIAGFAEATATRSPPGPELAVRLQSSIGLLEASGGKLPDARARYKEALAIAEQELGPDHIITLTTLNRFGNLARDEGRYAEARTLLERVVASRERLFGKDHPDVAAALNNLGNVDRAEGKLDDARRLYERALAIRIAAYGPDNPDVGNSYNNVGNVYADQEDQATAVSYYRKALALLEKAYGPNSVELAAPLGNLANSLDSRGDHEQAIPLFERVIAIDEAAYGPEHPNLIGVLSNLGVARQHQHRYDEAAALQERAARIAEKVLGPDHPDLADALGNLAEVLKHQRKLDEARRMIDRSQRIIERVYGPEHPRFGLGLVSLGEVQAEQSDHAGALENFRRGAEILEARLGKDHLDLSYALQGIGATLVKLHRGAEAIPVLERAVRIRTAAGARPNLVGEARFTLAEALDLDPRTSVRARAEAAAALAAYEAVGDTDDAAEVRRWLAGHP